mgnify:FL=1
MRKLALSDEILLKVENPARYIGNEVNSVMKDKDQISTRFAMAFPDSYVKRWFFQKKIA